MTPEERMQKVGLALPEVPQPIANYVPFCRVGELLFLSGQGPRQPDGSYSMGRVGSEVSITQAYADARLTGLILLSVAKRAIGDLSRIKGIVKLFGMVNAEPDFADHPKVINGCSDMVVDVLADAGRHARSAVGMGSLPNRMTVEIEAILHVE